MNSERKRRKKQQIKDRNGNCYHWCNKHLWHLQITLDHLMPISYGGGHSNDNLVISYFRCNNLRGNTLDYPDCYQIV
ncbi:HNH endonuclease [Nostoc sp.]